LVAHIVCDVRDEMHTQIAAHTDCCTHRLCAHKATAAVHTTYDDAHHDMHSLFRGLLCVHQKAL